jgi:hypothetical protein
MAQNQNIGLLGQYLTVNTAANSIILTANGYTGSAGQVLSSNSLGGLYWANAASGGVGYAGSSGYAGSIGTIGYTGSSGSGGVGYAGSSGYAGSIGTIGYTGSSGSGGGGGFSNGQSISVANLAITGSLTAANSVGTSGQTLLSTGTGVQWGTISPGYNYSAQFDGATTYLTTPTSTALTFGTGDFTIEGWIYFTNATNVRILDNRNPAGVGAGTWSINMGSTSVSFTEVISGEPGPSGTYGSILNTWAHFAVVRATNVTTIYVNGVSVASATQTTNFSTNSFPLYIGRGASTGEGYFTGYMSNIRIVKGVAVYTGAFTPQKTPFTATQQSGTNITAITGTATSLLTCQSITIVDNSTNLSSITNYGPVNTTTAQSPYASTIVSVPTASLTSVNQQFTGDGTTTTFTVAGGYTPNAIAVYYNGLKLRNGTDVTVTSGLSIVFAIAPQNGALIDVVATVPTTYTSFAYSNSYSVGFNGSSQYLSIAANTALDFGTGDFTIEFWMYGTSIVNTSGFIGKKASDSTNGWQLYYNSSLFANKMSARLGLTNDFASSSSWTLNTWDHWALTRSGTTVRWFKNGTLDATGTSSVNLTDTSAATRIGYTDTWGGYFGGFLSNIRVIKGTALYTASFQVPSAALTAVSGTSLLTCNGPTIVDGSTNAFTITNTGAATVNNNSPVFTTYTLNQSSSSSGGGLSLAAVQTANLTATAGYIYPINTSSGPVYVTLPASPVAGQQISITDYAGTFSSNNCIINPNGGKISGSTSNVALSASREGTSIVYVDSTQGWLGYGNFVANPIGGPYIVSYLVVAGGGGGATGVTTSYIGGGGGAGGILTGTTLLTTGTTYTFTIGSGGAGGTSLPGTNGANSVAFGFTAIGGGGGATSTSVQNGGSGGGGCGGGYAGAYGSGTSGQGFAGGIGNVNSPGYGGGGGGGAGAVGSNGSSTIGGAGGIGLASSITGSSVYYAGGGGGGSYNTNIAAGGTGGGGAGGNQTGVTTGTSGTANLGGGGGGTFTAAPGSGGSGVVILSIPTANYSGVKTGTPTVTTSGSYTILTFTASGSYTA